MQSRPTITPFTGWRSQAWSLVLFVALLRGLLPHAALAALINDGRPELAYCAPGKAVGSASAALGAHAQCVCAPAAEALAGAPLAPAAMVFPTASTLARADARPVGVIRPLPARARGPPSRLG